MNKENVLEVANEEKVNMAYDSMMSIAEGKQITDEEIEAVSKFMEENLTEDEKLLRKIQNGEIDVAVDLGDDESQSATTYVAVDPVTGKPKPTSIRMDKGDHDLQKAFDLDGKIGNIEDAEISEKSVKRAVEESYGKGVNSFDVMSITSAVKKFNNGDTITYEDMPTSIKSRIVSTIVTFEGRGKNSYTGSKELKDQMARSFVETIAMDSIQYEIDDIFTDLSQSIDNYAKKEIGEVYSNSSISQRDIMEKKFLEIANSVEEEKPEDAARLRTISKFFTESYTYEDMYKTFRDTGKLRVKKIDIEKISKTYKDFNYKYAKTKWNIRDISMLEPILDRNLPEYIDMDDIKKFLVVFCKYCRNFSPNNIGEHTYMYYFITNICSLDVYDKNNERDKEFYDQLIKNIINFIELIQRKTSKAS